MTDTSQVVYHAQCPHCDTVRKISHTQLQANKGLVQCRRCEQSYPARGHLLTTEQIRNLLAKAGQKQAINPSPQDVDAVSANATPANANQALISDIFEQLAAEAEDHSGIASKPQAQPMQVIADAAAQEQNVAVSTVSEQPKKSKGVGLFAKLLSKKTVKDDSVNDVDIVFETVSGNDHLLQDKAQLHVDVQNQIALQGGVLTSPEIKQDNNADQGIITDETAVGIEKNSSEAPSNKTHPFAFDFEPTDVATSAAVDTKILSHKANTTSVNASTGLVFDILPKQHDERHTDPQDNPVVAALRSGSGLHGLLTHPSAEASHLRPILSEAEVEAPEYDANKQWFTQFFSAANEQNQLIITQEADNQAEQTADETIQEAKRLNESNNTSSTVTMRLPENSMLVFTLEEDGSTHNQLSFLDIQESLPNKQAEPVQLVQNVHQNEHTMWTVACIVAILVLIIQMFYYFLLLTP